MIIDHDRLAISISTDYGVNRQEFNHLLFINYPKLSLIFIIIVNPISFGIKIADHRRVTSLVNTSRRVHFYALGIRELLGAGKIFFCVFSCLLISPSTEHFKKAKLSSNISRHFPLIILKYIIIIVFVTRNT